MAEPIEIMKAKRKGSHEKEEVRRSFMSKDRKNVSIHSRDFMRQNSPKGISDQEMREGAKARRPVVADSEKALIIDAIRPELDDARERFFSHLPSTPGIWKDLVGPYCRFGASPVQSTLLLLFASHWGASGEEAGELAAVVQYIEIASRLHEKRNPAHDPLCLLVGDLLFSLASERVVALGRIELVKVLVDASLDAASGRAEEIARPEREVLDENSYLTLAGKRRGAIGSVPCRFAAILAEASQPEEEAAAGFGHDLGVAREILREIRLWGATAGVEKASNRAGPVAGGADRQEFSDPTATLPFIIAWKMSPMDPSLAGLLERGGKEEDLEGAAKRVLALGADKEAMGRAGNILAHAKTRLDPLSPSKARERLIALAVALLEGNWD